MFDSLEEIGALLGFIAFAGLAVLVFLTFQQARHIRRLRDWAGRAPERAAAEAEEAAATAAAAAEAPAPAATAATAPPVTGEGPVTGEHGDAVDERERARERLSFDSPSEPAYDGPEPSRWDHMREEFAVRWDEWDRRSPVDPKLIVGGLVAVILGLGIATGGFGLLGGGGDSTTTATSQEQSSNSDKSGGNSSGSSGGDVPVAVLNGTADAGGVGVPGVADQYSNDVKEAGFDVELTDDAGSFTTSVVMWRGDGEEAANELAAALEEMIGETEVLEMTDEVEAISGDAEVALVIGQDDSGV